MYSSKYAILRFIAFIIVFFCINSFITFCLVPKGSYSRMTMREMYSQKDNIDIAFVGASLTQKDINPYIIDKELDCNTFDYAFSAQIYTGTYYSLKELFKYHKPKLVVLTTEPLSYTYKEEKTLAYLSVSMYMKPSVNKLLYYFGLSENGSYLDRLFAWRGYHVNSLTKIPSNIKDKLSKSYIQYPEKETLDYYKEKKIDYIGKGSTMMDAKTNTIDYNKLEPIKRSTLKIKDIKEKNVTYLKKIAKLCKENGSELIVLTTPFPRFEILKTKNYFEFDKEIKKISDEMGIEYYNYNLIKPELFEYKDEYFFDYLHLNNNGANEFSKSLSEFLKLRDKGNDMGQYFYSEDEFYESLKDISNTWFTYNKDKNNIKLTADALYSPKINPEYQFVLTDLDTGEEKIIRDYSINPKCSIGIVTNKKYEIRVNARVSGVNNSKIRYYKKIIET